MKTSTIACITIAWLLFAGVPRAASAPNFNLPTPEGRRVSLSALLKEGPVLLDFWATWCKPCIKAMPKLEEIHRKYKDRGLTVVGINEDGPRGQNRVKPFLRSRNLNFPILIDGDGSAMKRLQARSLPTTILIAQDSEIVLRQAGYTRAGAESLLEAIESLLPKPDQPEGGHAKK